MPFWPYFDPILSPSWAQTLALGQMCLFRPTALDGTLEDPQGPYFDPNFDHLDPFEGPGREVG